jgi:LysR family transcriptional regulator, transcriptional activator for dmlA
LTQELHFHYPEINEGTFLETGNMTMRGRRREDKNGKVRLPILSDFAAVEIFVAVMETRSVTKAAARLNTVPSAVSQRLSTLEKLAETKLFNRTTRSIAPTEAGHQLYDRCKDIVKSIEIAERELWGSDSHLSGDLKISAPVFFGMYTIAPILPEFLKTYPDLRVTIQLSAQEQDLLSSGFDLAIRMTRETGSPHNEHVIMANERVFCASPAYLEKAGTPASPQELGSHDCVSGYAISPFIHWPYRDSDGTLGNVRVHPMLLSDNALVLAEAVRQGLGIGLLGRRAISHWLLTGEIATILDDHAPPPTMLLATTPDTTYMPKKVKLFVSFLTEKLDAEAGASLPLPSD